MAKIYFVEKVFAQESKTVSNQKTGASSTMTTQKVVLRDLDGDGRENRYATRYVVDAIDCPDVSNCVGKMVVTSIKERTNISDKGAFTSLTVREIFSL